MTQAVTLSGLGSTNALYTDSSGNVGIGTSSPAYKLNVSKNGSGGDLAQLARFTDTNTANSIGPLHLTIGAANHYAVSPSPVLCGTNGIALGVGDGSDLANQRRLTIDASGNVGIGTSSPATYGKLVVKQTADTSISSLALVAQASTTDSQLGIGYDAASGTFRLTSSYLTTGSFKPISFWTSDAERMRIDSSGRVTMPYQPGFYSRRSIAGDGRPAGAQEWLVTGTGSYNTGGHFNASNGRFTAPVSGQYVFSAAPGYKQTGIVFNFYYAINGTSLSEPIRIIEGSSHSTATGTIVVYLSQGDYLQIILMGDHHVNTTFNFFSGHFLG